MWLKRTTLLQWRSLVLVVLIPLQAVLQMTCGAGVPLYIPELARPTS